jgi:hypothetical protein
VLSQLPRDCRHVGRTPCEDVGVVPEGAGEREFLFGVEVVHDDDFLGCVGQTEANLLDGWTWVQSCACTLLLRYLKSSLADLGCLSVGDSPRGPLKQTGESPLKTHDKPKLSAPHLNTQGRAHVAVAPTAHQDGPLKDPLEQAPPRSRAHASPERAPPGSRGCAYLEQDPPRSRACSALERALPRSRAPCTRTPVPVRGH